MQANQPGADPPIADEAPSPREAVIAALRRLAMDSHNPVALNEFIEAADLLFPNRAGINLGRFGKPVHSGLVVMDIMCEFYPGCPTPRFEQAIVMAALQPTTVGASVGLMTSLTNGADEFFEDVDQSFFHLFVASEALAVSKEPLEAFGNNKFQVSVESFLRFLFENDQSVESFVEEHPDVDLSVLADASRAAVNRGSYDFEEIDRLSLEFPSNHVRVAAASHAVRYKLVCSLPRDLEIHKVLKSVEETFVFLFKAMEAAQATRLSMLVRNMMVGSVQDNEEWLEEARRLTDPE